MRSISYFISAFLAIAGFVIFVGCGGVTPLPPPPGLEPTVSTNNSPMVYYTNAEAGLKITNEDYANTIGIYYGTAQDNLTEFSEAKVNDNGEYVAQLRGLQQGTKYYYQAYVSFQGGENVGTVQNFRTFVEGPVDLGLPSGLKWASVNLGAEYPTEAGGYYAWGETRTKQQYDLTTYLYCEGSWGTWTKYYSRYKDTDGKTVLDMEDDAARANLGGKWRMPQAGEFRELVQNCASRIETVNGVGGVIFYNKKTMDESVFIFFPLCGYVDGAKVVEEKYDGYYWSSNLQVNGASVNDDSAQNLNIYSISPGWRQGTGSRFFGESIRPVCE